MINLRGKGINVTIFILSSICLIISIKLFWNIALYADEFNTSPDRILGGDLWLSMDWLRLVLSGLISVLAGMNLFRRNK